MTQRDPRKAAPLGPSDSTDSASDLIGADDWREDPHPGEAPSELESNTDAMGTGERAAAGNEVVPPAGTDIAPDRVITSELPIVPDGLDRIDVDERTAEAQRESSPDDCLPRRP
jgi:hypothetical protein